MTKKLDDIRFHTLTHSLRDMLEQDDQWNPIVEDKVGMVIAPRVWIDTPTEDFTLVAVRRQHGRIDMRQVTIGPGPTETKYCACCGQKIR